MAAADFSVTKFKANLKHGGARPSLFKVEFQYPSTITTRPNPPDQASFLVKSTTIPASTIGSYDVFYHGKTIHVAGDRTFDTWDTTIINDEDMAARSNIIAWMRNLAGTLQGNRDSVFGGSSKVLASSEGDATVVQMGLDGAAKQSWKVHQMWPTELGEIALDWSSDAIEEYTVAFAYDYWSHGTLTSTTSVISTSISS